jgi:hypothetical protein
MSVSDPPRRATIRKAFEDWIKASGEHPLKSCGAVYLDDSHRDKWEAWEAAIDAIGAMEWEALRHISREERDDVMAGEIASANKVIAEMTASRQWISVSERPPKVGARVIATGVVEAHGFAPAREVREVWCHEEGFFVDLHTTMSGVTHWMPLPEPPQ